MKRIFIKKEGMALATLTHYLLGHQPGDRLKTINTLAAECQLSVGLVQASLKTLENSGAITVERCGRNGSYLQAINSKRLLNFADIGTVVCAMPLPYTRLYEGLASGLKEQFRGIPFYYAHMRGSDARVECLLNGVYDMTVVSRLAAQAYISRSEPLVMALQLGPHTYVSEHRLICRKGEHQTIQRVGLDPRSTDQRIMTDIYFTNKNIKKIEIPYHDSLQRLQNGEIDAVIWNVSGEKNLPSTFLTAIPLNNDPRYTEASEAVVLTRADNTPINQLINTLVVDKQIILAHQQRVLRGEQEPSY